ncbi:MAG: hypothetical protein J1E84_07435 [Muribaculaceae bacterium]|nr:hypothetical protein [Muribaculaceae bacterium]
MEALSVRDYRKNLAASFEAADGGTPVIIRRKNKYYALTSLGREDVVISPELERRIEAARRAYMAGDVVSCKNEEELNDFLDSL